MSQSHASVKILVMVLPIPIQTPLAVRVQQFLEQWGGENNPVGRQCETTVVWVILAKTILVRWGNASWVHFTNK